MHTKDLLKYFLAPEWKKVLIAIALYTLFAIKLASAIVCLTMVGVSCAGFWDVFINFSPFLIVFYIIACLIIYIISKKIITKEKLYYFLKPDKKKIILFLLIFFFFQAFFGDPYRLAKCDPFDCNHYWGYPFTFLKEIVNRPKYMLKANDITDGQKINDKQIYSSDIVYYGIKSKSYNFLNLFYDIIFWYLVSCLLIFIRDKIRRNTASS